MSLAASDIIQAHLSDSASIFIHQRRHRPISRIISSAGQGPRQARHLRRLRSGAGASRWPWSAAASILMPSRHPEGFGSYLISGRCRGPDVPVINGVGFLFLLTANVFSWRVVNAQAEGDVSLATPFFAQLLQTAAKEKKDGAPEAAERKL